MSQTKVTDAVRDVTVVDGAKITTGTIPEARITTLAATKLTGSIDAARVPEAAVTQHVTATDLTPLRQDIAMLALYNAVSDNRAAYNLPSSFIDQFEDDTGVTTQTDVDNVTEYFASVSSDLDANTKIHIDSRSSRDSNNDTGFVDDVAGVAISHTTSGSKHSTTQAKWSPSSIYIAQGDDLSIANHANLDCIEGTSDFTIDFWLYTAGAYEVFQKVGAHDFWLGYNGSNPYWSVTTAAGAVNVPNTSMHAATSAWHHIALVRNGSNFMVYTNGERGGIVTSSSAIVTNTNPFVIGNASSNAGNYTGYIQSFRISDTARWTAASITPPAAQLAGQVVGATGTLISDTQTVPSAITKMSGVILLKDGGSSTTTLGTHLTISFSATNGTGNDWVNVSTYTQATAEFSTGVKMIKLSETTVPSGTSPTIRAVWASQTDGGYESQLHGWAMNY